ncbi:MAG TPA: AAA family ATPase [Terriglobia bacterium]|nr:AAA family ATPase [Terriglobia bacterium]
MTNRDSELYEFGPFTLDVNERRFLRGECLIPLRTKVFDTLCVLVRNHGHLLDKDELIRAIWPDAIVEENNLAHNISILRKALGETEGQEKFVETIPRKGYRFLAEVRAKGYSEFKSTSLPKLGTVAPFSSAPTLVQREQEMAFLRSRLDRALSGKRQVVFVTGEAGLGKTSLVDAFAQEIQASPELWIIRGQCLEHRGAGEPYMPVLEGLSRLCKGPGGEEIIRILANQAPTWLIQMPWLVSDAQLVLLQHRVVGSTRERMLREIVEAVDVLSTVRPMAFILEDLHWSDYSSLDFIARLAQRQESARILLIATLRTTSVKTQDHPVYGMVQELKLRGFCEEIPMTFLSDESIGRFLPIKFPGMSFSAGFLRLIRERTEGNPLFMLSLVEHWIGEGILKQVDGRWGLSVDFRDRASIPDTLRQLVAQQLAEIGPEDREVLEAGSIAGMMFSAAIIAPSLELNDEEVEARCVTMGNRGHFLAPAGTIEWPDGTATSRFRFIHELFWQVLYEGVPAARKIRMHKQVGSKLETVYGHETRERAAELAFHFVRGRDISKGLRYLEFAAENAAGRSAYQEAIEHLNQGLQLIERHPSRWEFREQELALRTLLGRALVATRGWAAPEAEDNWNHARDLCRQLNNPSQVFPVLYGLAVLHEFRCRYRKSEELVNERLQLVSSHDTGNSLTSHMLLACSLFHQGAFRRALHHAEESLTLYDPELHGGLVATYGEDPGVSSRNWAAQSMCFMGFLDQGLENAQLALALASKPGHLYSLASAQAQIAFLHQYRREDKVVSDWAEATIDLASEQGFPPRVAQGKVLRGWAWSVQGRTDEGIESLQEGLAAYRDTGVEMDRPYYLALLAEAFARSRCFQQGLDTLDEALAMILNSRTFFYEAEIRRLRGCMLLQSDSRKHGSEAEDCFQQALGVARGQEAKLLELRAAVSLSQLWAEQGRKREAVQLLTGLLAWFSEGFQTPDLQQAQDMIRKLGSRVGVKSRSASSLNPQ